MPTPFPNELTDGQEYFEEEVVEEQTEEEKEFDELLAECDPADFSGVDNEDR